MRCPRCGSRMLTGEEFAKKYFRDKESREWLINLSKERSIKRFYCEKCGQWYKVCPSCGKLIAGDAIVCPHCGKWLGFG